MYVALPVSNYLFKVNNRNRIRCEICSNLTNKDTRTTVPLLLTLHIFHTLINYYTHLCLISDKQTPFKGSFLNKQQQNTKQTKKIENMFTLNFILFPKFLECYNLTYTKNSNLNTIAKVKYREL